jgi:hypothetical protein
MAQVIVELTSDERRVLEAYRKAEEADKKLRESTGKTGEAGQQASKDFSQAWVQAGNGAIAGVDKLIGELKRIGPEGRIAATAVDDHFRAAGKNGKQSMQEIIDKIGSLDEEAGKAAAEAAEKIKVELAQADASTKFDNSLTELRKINPEAAKAALAVREKMELADAEVKFDNIIEELKKLDPVAAAEAAKMRAHMKTAAEDSVVGWKKFAVSSAAEIGTVIGAYAGISEGVQLVNTYLKDQEALLQKALDKQIALAKVQQESAKNLASYKAVEQSELLQQAVPEIARAAGVSDVGAITTALGSAASAGATPEEAKAAVMAAARVNQLTSDKIDEATGAAVSIMKQTGLKDPREAIALLQTAGPLSKVDDAAQVAEVLPRALGTVQTVPNQDPNEAAKQIASFFAAATNIGVDEQGTSSATFTIDFMNRMDGLFTDLENKQIDARSKIELIDRKIEKGTATEANIRDKGQLQAFLDQSKGVVDPGTVFGRLGILQQNQGMQQEFLGDTGKFGEQQFQVFLKGILDANSDATRSVTSGANQIDASAQAFEESAKRSATMTPQIILARAEQSAASAIETNQSFNNEASALQFVRQTTASALAGTRRGGVSGFSDSMGESFIGLGALTGSTAIEEAGSAIVALRERTAMLEIGGLTQKETGQVEVLKATEQSIRDAIKGLVETGGISKESTADSIVFLQREAERVGSSLAGPQAQGTEKASEAIKDLITTLKESLDRQTEKLAENNRMMAEQNALLAETADNTRPGEPSPPDYNGVLNASTAEEDAR